MLTSLLTAMCLHTINSTTKFSPAITRRNFAGVSGMSLHPQTDDSERIAPLPRQPTAARLPRYDPGEGGERRQLRGRSPAGSSLPPPPLPGQLRRHTDQPTPGKPQAQSPRRPPLAAPPPVIPGTPPPSSAHRRPPGWELTWGWRNSSRWDLKRWTWPARFCTRPSRLPSSTSRRRRRAAALPWWRAAPGPSVPSRSLANAAAPAPERQRRGGWGRYPNSRDGR